MSELWLRLGLIAGALAVGALATVILRSRVTGRPKVLMRTGLAPGIYLFTSAACPGCSSARRMLIDELGESGFVELRWEQQPGVFHQLSVDAVPATVIVGEDGSGTLWPGRPERALNSLGP